MSNMSAWDFETRIWSEGKINLLCKDGLIEISVKVQQKVTRYIFRCSFSLQARSNPQKSEINCIAMRERK